MLKIVLLSIAIEMVFIIIQIIGQKFYLMLYRSSLTAKFLSSIVCLKSVFIKKYFSFISCGAESIKSITQNEILLGSVG